MIEVECIDIVKLENLINWTCSTHSSLVSLTQSDLSKQSISNRAHSTCHSTVLKVFHFQFHSRHRIRSIIRSPLFASLDPHTSIMSHRSEVATRRLCNLIVFSHNKILYPIHFVVGFRFVLKGLLMPSTGLRIARLSIHVYRLFVDVLLRFRRAPHTRKSFANWTSMGRWSSLFVFCLL